MLELVDPVGYSRIEKQAERRRLGSPEGKRVGFIWNQYPVTRGFWPKLEQVLAANCHPAHIERAYKSNTWAPLEPDKFAQIAGAVDYLVVGVGA
jgi:hypothetical protein